MIDTNDDELNPQRLIFGREIGEDDGMSSFSRGDHSLGDPITVEDADLLMRTGNLDPDERQNDGPPANVMVARAGGVDRLPVSDEDAGDVSVRLTGYVVPDHRPDSGIVLTGIVATPADDEGVIPERVKYEFELLGDLQTALDDETEPQTGTLFDPADELTTDDTLCRVWWD
jgi:hypothetical protein